MSLIFEAIACCCWFKMYAIDISDMIFLLWLAKIRMSSYLLMVASPLNQQTVILDGLNPSFWWLNLHFASWKSNCWWNPPHVSWGTSPSICLIFNSQNSGELFVAGRLRSLGVLRRGWFRWSLSCAAQAGPWIQGGTWDLIGTNGKSLKSWYI